MYVPDFVALYEIVPYIRNFPLDNETIRVALKDYFEGGELKAVIITKYGKICDWNTTNVTNMARLFKDYIIFNEDISKWDTSKVTNMYRMFYRAENFNQIIGDWDTLKVTNAFEMLVGATSFNVKNVSCSLLKIILGIHYESDSDSDDYDSDDE